MSRKNREKQPSGRENKPEGAIARDAAETSAGRAAGVELPPPPEMVPAHTPEMQDAELREMLCSSAESSVTAGALMLLWLGRNPYVCGGTPTPEDDGRLLAATRRRSVPDALEAIDTAIRPLAIIKASDGAHRVPCYTGYCPEWLADLVAAACRAVPSITYHDAVWSMPLCTLGHLAAAAHRASGGRTERPLDTSAADRWLLEANGIKQ